jgi:hypothetical protein
MKRQSHRVYHQAGHLEAAFHLLTVMIMSKSMILEVML